MDQQAQYVLGDVDLSKVDCDVTPQSVDEYLRQVAAGRMRIPEIAYVDRPEEPKQQVQKMVKDVDPLARTKEWQQQKVQFYRENREQLAQLRTVTTPLEIDWPSIYSPKEWIKMILKKPQAIVSEEVCELFPQHLGIPPTPEVLFSMTNAQVENLIQTLISHLVYKPEKRVEPTKDLKKESVESSDEKSGEEVRVNDEKAAREMETEAKISEEENKESADEDEDEDESHLKLCSSMQQWIYAVLLILEKNYLHDVLASLRDLANFCRKARSALAETELNEQEQEEMARIYSLFISIVAHYFEQKDLSD